MLHMPWRKWSTSSVVHKGSSVHIWCQQLGELHQVSAGEFGTATTNICLGLVESWCQRQTCCNLVWLHQVSPGWLCGGTTNADWSFCTIRWRWQCVVVINGNVWRLWINQIGRQRELRHGWSRYHLKYRNSSSSKIWSMCNVLKTDDSTSQYIHRRSWWSPCQTFDHCIELCRICPQTLQIQRW